ncbi:MAG: recombinase RecA [Myxococcota bacterium]
MAIEEKLKLLKNALGEIQKHFGRGSIMMMGGEDAVPIEPIGTIPSGSIGVDAALGIGGLPKGRIIEMFGPESSGKTTLALHAIANVQASGGVAAFIDAEHALDPRWAQTIGIELERLLVSQPDHGEQALEITETLVRSNAVDLVVVDSVAALVPKAEIEGEMGDSHMGLQARLMSQAMRKLTGHIARSGCALIFINQVRQKIGVMFGSNETTTGGNALKFYSSVRLDIRRVGSVKVGEDVVGSRVRVKVVKNKVAPPFRDAEFDIMYGQGVSWSGELLDLALAREVIEKSGSWYSVGDHRLGQGREKAREFLASRPHLSRVLRSVLLEGTEAAALHEPSLYACAEASRAADAPSPSKMVSAPTNADSEPTQPTSSSSVDSTLSDEKPERRKPSTSPSKKSAA